MRWRDLIPPAFLPPTEEPLQIKASEGRRIATMHRVGQPTWSPAEYRKLLPRFRTNPIVYRATRLIGQAVAGIDPVITVGDVDQSDLPERRRHPAAKLFQYPNAEDDRQSFFEALAGFYALSGEAPVELGMGVMDPVQMYALRPEYLEVIQGPDGWPMAYVYRANGGVKRWDVNIELGQQRFLLIKAFNPLSDIRGQGGLEPVAKDLDMFEAARDYAKALYDNGARPSGALVVKGNEDGGQRLTDKQYEALKAQLEERTGPKAAGKPLLLEGGLEWEQFGLTSVEMEGQAQLSDAGRRIALGLGVPPMLLGIPGDNTYSNYQEANRAFYRDTAIPIAKRLYGQIGRWLAAVTNTPDLQVTIDVDQIPALADEVSSKWQRVVGQNSAPLTLNEQRAALGYERLAPEIGERIYMNNFNVPIDTLVRTSEEGVTEAELRNVSTELTVQYQMQNPAFDPAKDADGDMQSGDGTAADSGRAAA
jgi:HK97 family phage portal protein